MSKVSAMQAMRAARYAAARTREPAGPTGTGAPRQTSTRPAPDEAAPGPDTLDPAGAAEPLLPAGRAAEGRAAAERVPPNGQLAPTDDALPADSLPAESPPAESPPAESPPAESLPAEALCGHRSMNSRSCRRPAGHPEKNHRYS